MTAFQKMANIANILPILVIFCKEITKHFGCDIFGSINTTILLSKLAAFLCHMKRHTIETYLPVSHINNPNHFQVSSSLILPSYHCDSVIVVIMFHKSHNIRNCAFCWNSSTFCWHNFFSVNIKYYTEVDQQKFVEKIRNGNHVLYQYTMWHMKCKAGELQACSIVLKT
jgi:hypothetical protein